MSGSEYCKNITISSAYCRWVSPPSTNSRHRTLISPCSLAQFKISDKASATKLKSKGDRGPPVLAPYNSWNTDQSPHSSWLQLSPLAQPSGSTLSIMDQNSKSNFKMMPFFFLTLNSCRISWTIRTPSRIYLPGIKAVWASLIILLMTILSLRVRTLVMILYMTLSNQIGLNCLIWLAPFVLGSRTMMP